MDEKITGADYFYFALYAFAGVGLELILVWFVEPLFGVSPENYTTVQNIIHWIATCMIWCAAGMFLIRLAKRKFNFDLWENKKQLKYWQYGAVLLCLAVSIASHYADWEGLKPVLELQRLGTLKFTFQYIYYIFEAFLGWRVANSITPRTTICPAIFVIMSKQATSLPAPLCLDIKANSCSGSENPVESLGFRQGRRLRHTGRMANEVNAVCSSNFPQDRYGFATRHPNFINYYFWPKSV